MIAIPTEFEAFLEIWRSLPHTAHPLLPCQQDIVPKVFGEFLPCMALTEMVGPQNLHIFFIGSRFEWNASLDVSGRNYYDLLPVEFHKPMAIFHKTLLETPCGAYISDVITTTHGSRYTHETVQMPYADTEGNVRFLMAYGYGRKPFANTGRRSDESHQPSSIKDMQYIDIGAGAPASYVENFEFHK